MAAPDAAATSTGTTMASLEFVRVTPELATGKQIPKGPEGCARVAAEFGFKSVLNVRSPDETDFPAWEAAEAAEAGLEYKVLGIEDPADLTVPLLEAMVDAAEGLPAPCLVHCLGGLVSSVVVLCAVGRKMRYPPRVVFELAGRLGKPEMVSSAAIHAAVSRFLAPAPAPAPAPEAALAAAPDDAKAAAENVPASSDGGTAAEATDAGGMAAADTDNGRT